MDRTYRTYAHPLGTTLGNLDKINKMILKIDFRQENVGREITSCRQRDPPFDNGECAREDIVVCCNRPVRKINEACSAACCNRPVRTINEAPENGEGVGEQIHVLRVRIFERSNVSRGCLSASTRLTRTMPARFATIPSGETAHALSIYF